MNLRHLNLCAVAVTHLCAIGSNTILSKRNPLGIIYLLFTIASFAMGPFVGTCHQGRSYWWVWGVTLPPPETFNDLVGTFGSNDYRREMAACFVMT